MRLLRCLIALATLLATGNAAVAKRIAVVSPSQAARVVVDVSPTGAITWQVTMLGVPVPAAAPIGLRFRDTAPVRLAVERVTRSTRDTMVTGLIGKASSARDHYAEAVIAFGGDPAHHVDLIVRAYDDGVAYRWRIRTDAGFALSGETAGFGLSDKARVWAAPAAGFQTSYERYYRADTMAEAMPVGALNTLPLLFQVPGGGWGAITEAALHDWAGLYLQRDAGASGLGGRLSPRLDRPDVAVIGGAGVHLSPWRVVLLGNAPGRLIESNLIQLLNPPADDRDWSWVKPGKTSFPWWNDYSWPGATFTPGLNTATMKAYIDFDAAHGIPYHTLDGYQDKAWYGGPIGPDGSFQDLTKATPAIDMPEVLRYAREKGVRIRLWTHWKPLREQMDRALATWEAWGVEGVMVDFMDRDDQQMVAFYDELARKAADHHLTVVYHGAYKPTGESRTWPNVLTREAVRGAEYNKFDDNPGSTPEHEATIPFTRMLAGPMDTHQGGFDAVPPSRFRIRFTAPMVMGTRTRTLANYVVQDNPLAMVADTPANYLGATGFDFVARVPSAWDETRVLSGAVGEAIVIARRKGDDWWIGAITDAAPRDVTVRLSMLGRGVWTLDGFVDDVSAKEGLKSVHATVRSGDTLSLRLAPAGGYAAHITRR